MILPQSLGAQVVDTAKDGSPSIFGWIIKATVGLGAIGATADGLIEDFALSALGGMMGAFGIGFDLGVFISQQFPYPSTTGDQSCHDYLDLVAEDPMRGIPSWDDACAWAD